MKYLVIDGEKFSELQVRQNRGKWLDDFRIFNRSDEVEKIMGTDKAFIAYRNEINHFLNECALFDLAECCKKQERIQLAKLRREDGHGPWDDKVIEQKGKK